MTEFDGTAALRGRDDDPGDADESDSLEHRVRALRLPDPPPRRGHAVRSLVALVAVAILSGGGWYSYRYLYPRIAAQRAAARPQMVEDPSPSVAPAPNMPSPPASPATVPKPTPAAVPEGKVALESKGYIIPARQVLVSPKVSGMVVYLNIEEGRLVKQGDVLARIETVQYEADVKRAEAALELARQQLLELERGNRPEEIAESQADLGEAEAQLVQLKAEWKRKTDLRGTTVVTAHEVEVAESQFYSMQKRVEKLREAFKLMKLGPRQERIAVAKAEVQQREADLVKFRWMLDNCTIRAPISGTILKKNAEEGNIVDAHFFSGSASLCEMADLANLEVDLMVQERDISRVKVGQHCQIRAEAWPDRVYEGVVSRQMPIADRSKGAVSVRVKVTVPAEEVGVYLKPEMGAVVTFFNEGY